MSPDAGEADTGTPDAATPELDAGADAFVPPVADAGGVDASLASRFE